MVVRQKRNTDTWSVAEAKAKLSEVIERAKEEGPQRVTKNGRDAVVVVSAEDWDKRSARKRTLLDILSGAQLEDGELDLERRPLRLRDIDL